MADDPIAGFAKGLVDGSQLGMFTRGMTALGDAGMEIAGKAKRMGTDALARFQSKGAPPAGKRTTDIALPREPKRSPMPKRSMKGRR